MKKKVIGLVGFIGSGKGTVGKYLIERHNFRSLSFASTLKDSVSDIFGWPRHLLEGDTDESRTWRELPDEYWSNKLKQDITPRWILQYIGTDILRNHFHENIWVWSVEKTLSTIDANVVITDCRFPNELNMLKTLNANLWWIQRGELPEWYSTAWHDKLSMPTKYPDVHASEYAWVNEANFTSITNNGILSELYQKIDKCLVA